MQLVREKEKAKNISERANYYTFYYYYNNYYYATLHTQYTQ